MKYKTIDGRQKFETVCSWCQERYYAERKTSRTCSSICRQGAYRGRLLLAKWRAERVAYDDARKAHDKRGTSAGN